MFDMAGLATREPAQKSVRVRSELPEKGVTLEWVDPTAESGWDSLGRTHPGFSFFHGGAWAKVLKKAYGFKPYYLVARRDHQLLALSPMMEARSWLNGLRGVSLPFTDECAPLLSDGIDSAKLSEAIIKEGKARNWKYWECRNCADLSGDVAESVPFRGHKLQLQPVEALFEGLDGAVRRNIKKAESSGLAVEISAKSDGLKVFYGLHCRTRKKHGLPPQPYSFFERINEEILDSGQGFVSLARLGDEPVAAAVFLHLGSKAIYKFGASNEELQQLRGSNLVIWEAIKWLVRNRFTELTFGRTSMANEGLRRFKLGWGTEEYRISYSKYDFHQSQFVPDADRASGWYNRVFALMPISLARWAGVLLYPHLV